MQWLDVLKRECTRIDCMLAILVVLLLSCSIAQASVFKLDVHQVQSSCIGSVLVTDAGDNLKLKQKLNELGFKRVYYISDPKAIETAPHLLINLSSGEYFKIDDHEAGILRGICESLGCTQERFTSSELLEFLNK